MLSLRVLLPLLFLTGCGFCGRGGLDQVGIQTREVSIVPVGAHEPSEVEGVLPALQKQFPGMTFRIMPAEPLPEGVRTERGSVFAELLMAKYTARGPGLVLLLDEDLSTQVFGVVYSQVDLPNGNAVVALPRLRTADGELPAKGAEVSPESLTRTQHRVAHQTVNAVGKLLGLFPCKQERCYFRRPDIVAELDQVDSVCARHEIILKERLSKLPATR